MQKNGYKNRNEIMLELARRRITENTKMSTTSRDEQVRNYSEELKINTNEMDENVEYEVEISNSLCIERQPTPFEMGESTLTYSDLICQVVTTESEICDSSDTNIERQPTPFEMGESTMTCTNSDIIRQMVTTKSEISDTNQNRKRNIKANHTNYARNITKENRMKGVNYQGYEPSSTKDVKYGIERQKRTLGQTCLSNWCQNSKMRNCSIFNQTLREHIFKEFWNMTWVQKQMYVCNLVKEVPKKRLYTDGPSRRNQSLSYYLKTDNGQLLQVCQKMFLNTLGLKEKMMRLWIKNSLPHGLQKNPADISKKRKEKLRASKTFVENERRLAHLKQFFEAYPKLESHYCRKDSKKMYLQTMSDSKTSLYNNEYVQECLKENIEPFSIRYFFDFLKEFNYSIFKPRKDQCDTCTEFQVGNLEIEKYDDHRNRVSRARVEMETDQKLATQGLLKMFCMDVQAVKLCPQLDASAQYYKMKLQIHNFTIYDTVSHKSTNYIWDETQGQLVASCFTTIICNHITTVIELDDAKIPIIIYSDGCGYQNRNEVLANAISNLSTKLDLIIEQKYLEKGHTQNHCDSTHSLIERKIKGKLINLPSEFVSLAKDARKKPFPLDVQHLTYEFFLNYDETDLKKYKSIRPGKLSGDPTVNQLRCLRYIPNGEIFFKINFEDEFQLLPQRCKPIILYREPSRMYYERLTISQTKFNHLQDLKKLMPNDTHDFYNNIAFHSDKAKRSNNHNK